MIRPTPPSARWARALVVVTAAGLGACSGPVETDVMVFDGGFGPVDPDATAPDATADDAGAPDRPDTPIDGGFIDGGAIDGGAIDGGFVDGGFIDGGAVDGGFIDGGMDDDGGFIDGGAVDGGFADGGAVDGGAVDGGFIDGGFVDTGVEPDTGVVPDTGVEPDTGVIDTGVVPDTGVPDAGQPDAGPDDTGVFPDAGPPDMGVVPDAGPPDTGVDAGPPDTGVDAGPPDTGVPNALPPPTSYTRRLIDNQMRHGQHVTIVDADGDGDLDVVASISLTDTVRLYLNGGNSNGNGNGATWSTVQVAPNNSIVAMATAVADFDGDMDLDVVALGFFDRNIGFNSRANMTFYRRGATVNNWTPVVVPVGMDFWGPRAIAAGDLTGDGRPDLVTGSVEWYDAGGNVVGNGVRWHRYTNGNFALPVVVDAGLNGVEGVEIVDVDGDGVLDIVAVAVGAGQVVWFENNRTAGQVNNAPTFTRHVLANAFAAGHVAMGQMDADPELEAVVVDANSLAWYDAPTNPRGLWTRNVISTNFGGTGGVLRVAVGDVNNDGLTDVAAASAITGQVRAFVRTNTGWIDQLVRNQTGADAIATGDLSGDGRDDLIGTTYENTPTADRVDWYQTVP